MTPEGTRVAAILRVLAAAGPGLQSSRHLEGELSAHVPVAVISPGPPAIRCREQKTP